MDLHQPFLINHRFLIDPSRHSVLDLQTQSETRLELRHINLLGQLCRNTGKLVERDFLIKEIWNDYSGADDALTQGISALRKLLADEKKELIKTIPKKGYIFQAEISVPQPTSPVRGHRQSNTRVWIYGMLSGVAILAVLSVFLRGGGMQETIKPETVGAGKFQYVPAPKPIPSTPKPAPDEETKRIEKNSSPPPGGKDDARETTTNK